MKHFSSLLMALVLCVSAMAETYVRVTEAPANWEGEYVLTVVTPDGSKAVVWDGTDNTLSCDTFDLVNGKFEATNVVKLELAALAEGYSAKVVGGPNDGKYISSGTSAPTYSNGLKFNATAHRVDFAFRGDTLDISQTTASGTMYLVCNASSTQQRFRFYKANNHGNSNYPDPVFFKLEETVAPGPGTDEPEPREDYDSLTTQYTVVPGVGTFDEIRLPSVGYMTHFVDFGEATNLWMSGDYGFTTYVDNLGEWGVYYYGFTLSSLTENDYNGYSSTSQQEAFKTVSGGAHSGANFAVWNKNFNGDEGIYVDGEPRVISGFYVNNTTWVKDAIVNGDGMGGDAFTAADSLVLLIYGMGAEGDTLGTVHFNLAANGTYVQDWTFVDLSSLGAVAQVIFDMVGSKNNDLGLTTPAYFAMDDFGAANPNPTPVVLDRPATSAAAPTAPANRVMKVYTDAYAGAEFSAHEGWGDATVYEEITLGENDHVRLYSNLNYLGWAGGPLNVVNMEYLHIDIWAEENGQLGIVPIFGGAGLTTDDSHRKIVELVGQQWNSFDLALATEFEGLPLTSIFQFKFDNAAGNHFGIDNVYFYRTTDLVDTEAPQNVYAVAGAASYFHAAIQASATDNMGAVNFIVKNGETEVAKLAAVSGDTVTIYVPGLTPATAYNFSVVATDELENAAEAIQVAVTTLAAPAAAPAPAYEADSVLSLYSDAYTFAPASLQSYNEGWWDNPSMEEGALAENEHALFYYGRLTGMIGWQFAPVDATGYTTFSIDIYPAQSGNITVGPLFEGERDFAEEHAVVGGQWNTITIDLTGKDLTALFQVKMIGYAAIGEFFVDNVLMVKPTAEPEPVHYDHLYVIGDNQGWKPEEGVEMEKLSDNVFKGTFTFTAETSYFAFTTVQTADWAEVNANRFGGATNNELVADGSVANLAAGELCLTIAAGQYEITVDLNALTASIKQVQGTDLDNLEVAPIQKLIRDGQVIILRGEHEYNAQGQLLK